MDKFTLNVFINRSQQKVFDFFGDPANIPKWDSDFASAEWTSRGAPGMVSIPERSSDNMKAIWQGEGTDGDPGEVSMKTPRKS